MNAASPLTEDAVAAITSHLNDDHAADMLDICRTVGKVPDAETATVIGVDLDGIVIDVTVHGAPQVVRVLWPAPITSRADVRTHVVTLYQQAQAMLVTGEESA